MNKTLITSALLLALGGGAPLAFAQADHDAHHGGASASAAAEAPLAERSWWLPPPLRMKETSVRKVASKGRKSFWRLDPAPNVTRRTDSHPGLLP